MSPPSSQQEQFNSQFASDVADLRLRLQVMTDAVNAIDSAIRGTFELLIAQGMLPEDAAGIKQYEKAMANVRKAGIREERPTSKGSGTGIKCPSCQSVLQVRGARGDRCDWCGYKF